jgi:phosphoglycolate phosphatase
MTRLVVFDLDGTIVDSASQIVAAMRAGYTAAGCVAPDGPAILSIVGISLPQAVERLSPGVDAWTRDLIVTGYRAAFRADTRVPPLYNGAAETLVRLAERGDLRLSVATGKTKRGLLKVLDQHGLRPLFHSLHGGDEHPSKPNPAMLCAAMAAADVGSGDTLMVGDSVFDIEMAVTAGVRAFGVSWGYCLPRTLLAAGASAVLEDFRHLPGMLDGTRGHAA